MNTQQLEERIEKGEAIRKENPQTYSVIVYDRIDKQFYWHNTEENMYIPLKVW